MRRGHLLYFVFWGKGLGAAPNIAVPAAVRNKRNPARKHAPYI